jgi:dolichyl-phosphate beta-glucosyltransferase
LSLVVPSYNEEARLPVMLEETAEYLKQHKYAYEIIIVNDGSKDDTTNVALETSKRLKINTIVI